MERMQVSPFAKFTSTPLDCVSETSPQTVSLKRSLDDIVTMFGNEDPRSFSRFIREARKAWHRQYPSHKRMGVFQTFIKEHMSTVCEKHPHASHKERMNILSSMWNEAKPSLIGTKRNACEEDLEVL